MSETETSAAQSPKGRAPIPLYVQVLVGVALGVFVGMVFKKREIVAGIDAAELGQIGMLVIRMLKTLATPLIFFAILDAFFQTRITAKRGGKMVLICLMNVAVAMSIGLAIMNAFHPGERWQGHLDQMISEVKAGGAKGPKLPTATDTKPTLDPVANLSGYIPENVVDPFQKNAVISIVLLALLLGASFRKMKDAQEAQGEEGHLGVERTVNFVYHSLAQALTWVVHLVPYAVFGVVAKVVGEAGVEVFRLLAVFLVTILAGLALHALVYYPLVAWWMGGKPPKLFLGRGADAILTGLSMNSSLGTVPVTLRCLRSMGVSNQSARLSACVGTNLNNDGITLYEAMTALFLAQALGYHLGLGQQLTIVFASIMAGAGIAGIPEAGLIVLPLVLSAAGLPEQTIVSALALIFPVDWIIARCRSGVNVMGDMVVAIQLDRGTEETETDEETPSA